MGFLSDLALALCPAERTQSWACVTVACDDLASFTGGQGHKVRL